MKIKLYFHLFLNIPMDGFVTTMGCKKNPNPTHDGSKGLAFLANGISMNFMYNDFQIMELFGKSKATPTTCHCLSTVAKICRRRKKKLSARIGNEVGLSADSALMPFGEFKLFSAKTG